MTISPDLDKFVSVGEAVARLLHPNAEIVIHDMRTNRIAAIFNPFSRRKVGDESLIEDMESLKLGPDNYGPFPRRTFDGRRLKYVSSLLRNDSGEAVGLMCISMDVSVFETLEGVVRDFIGNVGDSSGLDQMFDDDWQQRIDRFVRQYLQEHNLGMKSLGRKERIALVGALHEAGAFRVKDAANYVARVLDVSRATVYSDLGKVGRK